jgi:ribonuclease Z
MGHGILLDAGEGAQLRLVETGFSVNDVDVIALTHSHGDHINGLPGLLQSMYMNSRRKPLTIFADRLTAEFIREALEVGYRDLGFEINLIEISGEGEYVVSRKGGDLLVVKWFPVCHTIEAYGFTVEWRLRARVDLEKLRSMGLEPGPWISELLARGEVDYRGVRVKLDDISSGSGSTRIVYTGDTRPCRTVVNSARGARLLIHDSTFDSSLADEAAERGHSTSLDSASVAYEAGVDTLVLAHISPRYRDYPRIIVDEARRVFPRSIMAWDKMRLRLTA